MYQNYRRPNVVIHKQTNKQNITTTKSMPEKDCLYIWKEDHLYQYIIVQELCESRGGRPGLSVLTSLLVSVDVKNY